jgi:cytoskeletal protein RodZ
MLHCGFDTTLVIDGRNRMRNSSLFLIAAAKRMERGISLDQIATATKISVRSLKAIEEGDFRKLPGGIYNTSYIRQYARAIEVDEYELIAVYEASTAVASIGAPARKESVNRFLPAMQE